MIFHLTQGGATLALGWYVMPRWAFCRFAAVDIVDGVDIVDVCCRIVCSSAFRLPYVSRF